MKPLILEELNVKTIDFVAESSELTTKRALPQFKQLGPKFGKQAKKIAEIIRNLSDHEIQIIEETGKLAIGIDGQEATVESHDLDVMTESAEGLVVQSDESLTVALDTCITDALRKEGLAREFVNRIQNMRKSAGFEVVDRIRINYEAAEVIGNAIESQSEYIRSETLAEELVPNSGRQGYSEEWLIEGTKTRIGIEKVAHLA